MEQSTKDIRSQLVAEWKKRLESMSTDDKKVIRDRLWNMIQYAIGRHDYWENYRTRYLTIATALFAVAATGISILVNAKITGVAAALLFAAFIDLGATGLYIIYRFRKETTPDYPYRKEAEVKSWIYLYTLPPNGKVLIDFKSNVARKKAAKKYVESLQDFSTRWMKLTEEERMQEDLEQVLILYTLQAYKREFVKRLARSLQIGTALFLVLLTAAFLAYFLP